MEYRARDFWAGLTECWRYKPKTWKTASIDNWALILCQRGTGAVQLPSGVIDVKEHDVLLLTPGYMHTFMAGENWEILWHHFMLPAATRDKLRWPEMFPGFRIAHLSSVVFSKVKMSMNEAYLLMQTQPPNWYDYAMALLNEIIFRIDNFVPAIGKNSAEWLEDAVQELMALPVRNIDDIARDCGMSHTKFYNLFHEQTGYSPSQYRDNLRMRKAESLLLNTHQAISQISDTLGFNSPFYFSLRFKAFYGCSPSEFRMARQKRLSPGPDAHQ